MTCPACGAENRGEARFCDVCGARLGLASREQRKVVTVLFCDVAGSTALGERLDPEVLRAIMSRYFDVARSAIERHGGTVEKFIGDAVMAVFGIPIVREDDALRAVRAALELRDGVGVDVRIGVNTGEVVTGTGETLATGDAVNVAARLEQAASTGEVLLGEDTYRLVRCAVEVEPRAAVNAKGKSAPVAAFRLVRLTGDTPYVRRMDARLVGRVTEQRLLNDAWRRTWSEGCSLVTVLGAAGVGKSRLAGEFVAGVDATVLNGRCLSYGDGITYWPVVEIVLQLLDGRPPPNPQIAALLGNGEMSAGDIAFAVRRLFEAEAAVRPLVVVFDDLQWAEQTLLDLIEETGDWSRGAPIMLLCLARPELLDVRPSWGAGKPTSATVRLEPLSVDEVDELIEVLLDGGMIDHSVRGRIRSSADGNPLFVEQMLAMAAEAEGELIVPATIQALLAARLDQLPTAERAALERGAIEGQVFHRGAVVALAPDDPEISRRLLRLVRKDLVRPSESVLPGDDAFRFRHLLIRDAAYDALPKAVRAELHELFARWLEAHGQRLVELDEILGFHLEQAARYLRELGTPSSALEGRASARLVSSGLRAYGRGDMPAAVTLLRRATALLPADDVSRLELLPTLGYALYRAGALTDAEALLQGAVAEAGRQSRRAVELDAELVLAEIQLNGAPDQETGQARAWEVVERAVAWAQEANDSGRLGRAVDFAGRLHFWRGEVTAASEAFERAADAARRAGDAVTLASCVGYLFGCWHIGLLPLTEAAARLETVANEVRNNRSLALRAAFFRARFGAMMGEFDLARVAISEALDLASGLDVVSASQHAGQVELAAGDLVAAEREFRRAHDLLVLSGDNGHRASIDFRLADAVLAQGRIDEALELTESIAQLTVPEDIDAQAGWRRVRARALAHAGHFEQAERLAREAVTIAFGAEFYDARADSSAALAEVLEVAGRTDEAKNARQAAVEMYEHKGDLTAASRLRQILGADDAGRPSEASPA